MCVWEWKDIDEDGEWRGVDEGYMLTSIPNINKLGVNNHDILIVALDIINGPRLRIYLLWDFIIRQNLFTPDTVK